MSVLEEITRIIWVALSAAVLGLGGWVVRTVFTNNKQLELLEQKQCLQHTEMVKELKTMQAENKEVIIELKQLNVTMMEGLLHDKSK